jgi:hypothetical protein
MDKESASGLSNLCETAEERAVYTPKVTNTSLSPNPVVLGTHVKVVGMEEGHAIFTNTIGVRMLEADIQHGSINTTSLPSGWYHVKLKSNSSNDVFNTELIIVR